MRDERTKDEKMCANTINGKEVAEILLDKLNKAIAENNVLTDQNNKLMIKYTKVLTFFTAILIVIGVF
jgi:hypothetical protein